MLRRGVKVFIAISVAIVCASCFDHHRHREMFNRRSYNERPSRFLSPSILTGTGEDGNGYELQLDGDSHITSYLKALDVPEPLYRNPHIIASFDESLIPAAMARRFAQRRASEAASIIEQNQSTSSNQTREEVKGKDERIDSAKSVEVVTSRPQESVEEVRQVKESMDLKEPQLVILKNKEEQLNPLESRLPIGGRMSKAQSQVAKFEEVSDNHDTSNYGEVSSRHEPKEKRPLIRVTKMETQEFTERGRGSSQEPREFVLLMDSDRSATPSLQGSLRPRPRANRDYSQGNRQTILVPVPLEESTSPRDIRGQSFRAAQLGSPPQMKLIQMVSSSEPDTRTRVREMVKEAMQEEQSRGIDEVRHPKSSSRSPLVNQCLQLCSCCSALMGKNLVPLLV